MLYIIDSKQRRTDAAQAVANLRSHPVMQVEIKEYRKNRSTSQNRLYWMWLNIMAKDTVGDNGADELHEQLKVKFLGVEHKIINGIACIIPKSTSSLTVGEFTEYLHKVEQLALELDIALPIPDDYGTAMGHKESSGCAA